MGVPGVLDFHLSFERNTPTMSSVFLSEFLPSEIAFKCARVRVSMHTCSKWYPRWMEVHGGFASLELAKLGAYELMSGVEHGNQFREWAVPEFNVADAFEILDEMCTMLRLGGVIEEYDVGYVGEVRPLD